jgi:hypothetical protein
LGFSLVKNRPTKTWVKSVAEKPDTEMMGIGFQLGKLGYPLVNIQKLVNISIFNGKTHDFAWAIFQFANC